MNGGPTPNGQGLGTQSSPNTGGSSVLTAPGSNANTAPTGTNGGEAQPTTSDPNVGGVGSSPEAANTQTSSFTLPPGAVPYGGFRPSSMTTLASMIAWTEPDGEKGPTTMMQDDMRNHGESSSTFELEVEEVPTTVTSTTIITNTVTVTSTSTSVDPRWQRIRPVWIW
ncbi:hypothetical protein F4815DRAFT_480989 [Daldinia loculata]|nr:hypothetical protein F4815DRAFT_480989 [Daldinia loculata]